MSTTDDIGKIATALGLFASCIKSGENWSARCESVNDEAHEALWRLAAAAGAQTSPPPQRGAT